MIEIINTKLEEIRKQKGDIIANLNALSGAEQVLLQLIEEAQMEEEVQVEEVAE